MTKRIICALLCVIFAFFLIGCGTPIERVNAGNFTILLNPDGSSMIWEGN